MKSGSRPPPPGNFTDKDIYGTSMLKKGQRFAEEFWSNWRDYLATIERRSKWNSTSRNVKVGDIVTDLDENATRNEWKLGAVVAVKEGRDGLVRLASIRVSDHTQVDKGGKRTSTPSILERPIQKLIIVMRV